jgi:hypothetical protein
MTHGGLTPRRERVVRDRWATSSASGIAKELNVPVVDVERWALVLGLPPAGSDATLTRGEAAGLAMRRAAAMAPPRPRGWTAAEVDGLRAAAAAEPHLWRDLALMLGMLGRLPGYPADAAARGMA